MSMFNDLNDYGGSDEDVHCVGCCEPMYLDWRYCPSCGTKVEHKDIAHKPIVCPSGKDSYDLILTLEEGKYKVALGDRSQLSQEEMEMYKNNGITRKKYSSMVSAKGEKPDEG